MKIHSRKETHSENKLEINKLCILCEQKSEQYNPHYSGADSENKPGAIPEDEISQQLL